MLFQSHKDVLILYVNDFFLFYYVQENKPRSDYCLLLHWLEMYVYPCVHHYSWCSMPVPAGTFSHIKSYDFVTNPFIPLIHRGLVCWPEILSICCITVPRTNSRRTKNPVCWLCVQLVVIPGLNMAGKWNISTGSYWLAYGWERMIKVVVLGVAPGSFTPHSFSHITDHVMRLQLQTPYQQ